jgi:predicted transcriptional regulator
MTENVPADRLPLVITALDHPMRLRVIAVLRHGRRYVSALARDLGISRPLLYMHLDRLEKAGLVGSSLELGPDGKAQKWYELLPFELRVTADTVAEAVEHAVEEP